MALGGGNEFKQSRKHYDQNNSKQQKKLPTQKYTEEKFNERKNDGGNLLDPLRKERKSANKSTIYIKVNNKD